MKLRNANAKALKRGDSPVISEGDRVMVKGKKYTVASVKGSKVVVIPVVPFYRAVWRVLAKLGRDARNAVRSDQAVAEFREQRRRKR